MRKLLFIFFALELLAPACKKEVFDGPDRFSEDFEDVAHADSLFPAGDARWSLFQKTFPGNYFEIDTLNPHSGNRCLKFFAVKSPADGVSKCSIAKQNMAFWEGETVRVEAWYYIEGTAAANWMFLLDLEEQAPVGAGPGMRIANIGAENNLVFESKFLNPTVEQFRSPKISFPRDQWVKLSVELKLAQNKKGSVRVWQDDVLIISKDDCKTLPKDFLYTMQGTLGRYSSVEFGLTANAKDNDMTLYVDDISIEVVR
jgi:hypothetical protein